MKTVLCYSHILRRGWTLALAIACVAGLTSPTALRADVITQSGYSVSPPVTPTPTLSVSVNLGRYSVDANHADVRSVLKLLFDRADKQIVFANSVTGDVTIRLKDQSFQTILNAICEDTFLRWTLDTKTNIYRFERDQEAVARSIARLNALNTVFAAKLSELGLNVPQQMLDATVPGTSAGAQAPNALAGGFGGGGFGRGSGSQRELSAGRSREENANLQKRDMRAMPRISQSTGDKASAGGAGGGRGGAQDNTSAQFKYDARGGLGPAGEPGNLSGAYPSASRLPLPAQNNASPLLAQRSNVYRMQNGVVYEQIQRQNGLVSLDTKGQKIPVADALQQLGQQSNVLILLDPSVPGDDKFTIRAAIPPRSFQEVMTLIASYAQLNWRYLGNRILVTPTPEFQLFWGNSDTPRVSTPNAEKRATPDK